MGDVIERTETLAVEPASALGGLLGVPVPDVAGGAGLPLLWHWCYLLDRPAPADLGPGGDPAPGGAPAPGGGACCRPRRRPGGAGCGPAAGCAPPGCCVAASPPPG